MPRSGEAAFPVGSPRGHHRGNRPRRKWMYIGGGVLTLIIIILILIWLF
jgi:type II secretory pathway component PulM